jgi:hypothetical protein
MPTWPRKWPPTGAIGLNVSMYARLNIPHPMIGITICRVPRNSR